MFKTLQQRLLTTGGTLLVTGGLGAASLFGVPALAADAPVQLDAVVGNAISLSANAPSVSLAGVPGTNATASSGLVATSNNAAGYRVTVAANNAALLGTGTNTNTIAVSNLSVGGSAASVLPVQIHNQITKSAAGGDAIPVNYAMTMPHVNADTYSVGLTFTATAN